MSDGEAAEQPTNAPPAAEAASAAAGGPRNPKARKRKPRRRKAVEPQKAQSPSERIAPHAHLLGRLSDIAVAQRAGVRPSEVAAYRAGIGPDPSNAPTEEDLPPEPEAPAEAAPAAEAEAPRRRRGGRRKRPGPISPIAKFQHLLGVLPDHEVAKRAGVTTSGVLKYRQRHGVAAAPRRRAAEAPAEKKAPPPRKAGRGGPRRGSRLDAFRDVVGVLSDREVAGRAGVTTNAVQMYRKKHGIPPSGKRAPRAAAVQAVEAPRPAKSFRASAGLFGWRIRIASRTGDLERIVVARDATAACAAGATAGEVLAVERIGEAIAT